MADWEGMVESPATRKFTFKTEAAVDCPPNNENSFLWWPQAK